jgi:hypothetical protein
LRREGNTFVGGFREEGTPEWTLLGQATAPFSDTLLIGLAVYNQGSDHATSAEFDHVHVSQLVPPVFATPCGTTNQVQPVVRGLATSGTQVRLYTDGVQIATTTATPGGAFVVSPMAALGPGFHTLTATVTGGDGESSSSPGLGLTVDPTTAIDLIGVTIAHAPLFRDGPPVIGSLRNRDSCAACDGTGFNVWVPGGKPITVSVPVSATAVTSVTVRVGGLEHTLKDPDGDGIYEGTFVPPPIRGLARLTFAVYRAGGLVIEYSCGEMIIDPYGVVYDAALGPGAPIAGAVVTLYQQDQATRTWHVWTPTDGQENPQMTGAEGRYAFAVPQGTYYVTVQAPGYAPYASQPIEVSEATGPVELLVPLDRAKATKVFVPLVQMSSP